MLNRRRWLSSLPLVVLTLAGLLGCGGGGGKSGDYTLPADPPVDPGDGGTLVKSSNADLYSLEVSPAVLSPAFSPSVIEYSAGPPVVVGTLRIKATLADLTASLTMNGVPVPSGVPSTPIPLPFGITPVFILVTAANGTTKSYTVKIVRDAPGGQEAYVKASNTGMADNFGASVAISGNTLVVGARSERSTTGGVNPGAAAEAEDAIDEYGAVYVFVRSGTTWTQQAFLKASNPGARDRFGSAVAISGDTIVVGAPGESSNAVGVNAGLAAELNNSKSNSGAAYVFVRSGASWTQQAYLKASNTDAADGFGSTVAIDYGTIVIGAPGEDSGARGINPGPAAEALNDAAASGAAYVFTSSGGGWTQAAYMKPAFSDAGDAFGGAVAISGTTIVVGAQGERSSARGVNQGLEADNSLIGAGAAYVFVNDGFAWVQEAYVKASNTGGGDAFGSSVAVSRDTIAIGARTEASSATGVNPGAAAEADDSMKGSASVAHGSGAVYVFARTNSTWAQQAYVKASNTGQGDGFGISVALDAETLVVGAIFESGGAAGVDPAAPAESDNSVPSAGAVYVFLRTVTTWQQASYVKPSTAPHALAVTNQIPPNGMMFGWSVGISGDTIVTGCVNEDSPAKGVNGGPVAEASRGMDGAGAVYVFR